MCCLVYPWLSIPDPWCSNQCKGSTSKSERICHLGKLDMSEMLKSLTKWQAQIFKYLLSLKTHFCPLWAVVGLLCDQNIRIDLRALTAPWYTIAIILVTRQKTEVQIHISLIVKPKKSNRKYAFVTLLLVMVLFELQNTYKKVEQKKTWKTQYMLYFRF